MSSMIVHAPPILAWNSVEHHQSALQVVSRWQLNWCMSRKYHRGKERTSTLAVTSHGTRLDESRPVMTSETLHLTVLAKSTFTTSRNKNEHCGDSRINASSRKHSLCGREGENGAHFDTARRELNARAGRRRVSNGSIMYSTSAAPPAPWSWSVV
ncbi:hypothetical protein J6590_000177 [Homalodisca vitripennis]|nr:hypothetical protein J6590_000177 [Homalodisca vitripennis]